MTSLLSRPDSTSLADTLRRRLPDLAAALDEDQAAEHVRSLLPRGTDVHGVSAGKAWLRTDGTCTLRYDVRLGRDAAESGRRTVLCRVHTDENAAAEYVRARVLPLAGDPPPSGSTWRACAVVVAGTGIALHPFPVDPDLPGIRQAIDPLLLQRLLPDLLPRGEEVRARVVHHPRRGACVLRYDVTGRGTTVGDQRRLGLYGKVYGDDSGAVVERRLSALAPDVSVAAPRPLVRFPSPVTYDRALRLLLMRELPGSPAVPRLLADALASGDTTPVAVTDAVRRCGRALAALHSHRGVTAPTRGADVEMTNLLRELRLVAAVWPGRAERVRQCIPEPPHEHRQQPALCHGDYTPAQVLLSAGTCGVTDLDDLCWADPALDVGRFLASLDLLAAKGRPADASLRHDLAAAFLDGYRTGSATPGTKIPHPSTPLLFYRRISLARSALHACRQLKDDRFARAVALLEPEEEGSG